MSISPEDFVKRLDAISEQNGVAYARAHLIFDKEEKYSREVLRYKGYLALSNAFKCFFLETVELVNIECRPKIKNPLPPFYGVFVPRLTHIFQSLCGAERVAIHGYPYHGYTLLRNVFDNIVLTSAALQKITDFYSVDGIVPGKDFDPVAVKRLRKDTEFAVRRKMTGDQSGLSQQTLQELSTWDALFDYETHGARLSLTHAVEWMKGEGQLPVLPQFDEMAFALFMNRFCEVGWMAHRLIPLLQPSGIPLPEAWGEKWRIVDDSFSEMVESLTKQLGKKIGTAIMEFVKIKFPFNERFTFPQ
jgi:hypothetical protein